MVMDRFKRTIFNCTKPGNDAYCHDYLFINIKQQRQWLQPIDSLHNNRNSKCCANFNRCDKQWFYMQWRHSYII